MRLLILTLAFPFFVLAQKNDSDLLKKYKEQAKRVTIIRDTWGIPHIYGKTDADAVFGLLYTECEENFPRVEKNYLEMMGRSAEIEGKKTIYDDLEMRLIYDSSAAKRDYKISPAWFKKLLQAFADGINYYLVTHPDVKPLVLKRFEPWFPLMYTDGSIAPTQDGGLTMKDLLSLYAKDSNALSYKKPVPFFDVDPSGSNGFAVAPVKTANKNSILYINPHVSFYFRTEVHMVSEEGLNVYGAVTWGQFFVYQGFNQHCGWMHTSSYADVADLYEEKIVKKTNGLFYQYDGKSYPVKTKRVTINYKGVPSSQKTFFTTYATLHGPVMGMRNSK
ncbi:MAG TPA: penicillin acylase family protein, partial [Flavisolibacter sp.]|nr:penicillin acylase family protein [Flavisolibacter sp.]